ncbi:hypothetical protein D515_02960 [Grimontia indica]|uniref:J domain-containing protein n=1 Tax=Grimontia indica TaxID=1056512 RepID=R1GQM7_9GAMM|nr:hypothetical protein [Grimontia indica]EOD78389.1 hypothetical protein D515_02960 [Grimontia indica]
MTTFNEILGTKSGDPESTVKQRYKLLSVRVHPDKGGSKALMHLVRHSYDNIVKGKGEHPLAIPAVSFATGGNTAALERELSAVKKERDELSALNQLLKVQLNQARKGSTNTSNSTDYSRKIAQLEGEMVLLKEERNRLQSQKDAAIVEQGKLAGELRRALSENEMLETELERNAGVKMPGAVQWAQKFWLPAMAMSSLVAVLFLGATMVNWSAMTVWFDSEEPEVTPPKVTVVHAKPKSPIAADNEPATEDNTPVMSEALRKPFLQLTNKTGVWSLASYTETERPYIAIRSDNGSYIVNDCSGEFRLYLNEPFKPLRVAANLIYLHQNQHFHVYKIPYGQGSSAESWLQSRKLQINDELFTSEAFRDSRSALLEKCRS